METGLSGGVGGPRAVAEALAEVAEEAGEIVELVVGIQAAGIGKEPERCAGESVGLGAGSGAGDAHFGEVFRETMLEIEAEWLGERMARLPDESLFPLLNVGSSTLEFRTRVQPHIEGNLFAPLRRRGGKVWHLDIKSAEGVDIVGDLCDPEFLRRISELEARSVLVSNLFEHVKDRRAIAGALLRVVPAGGYLFVSGPHRYPYHADPIDTLFRPTVEEMAAYFPGTTVLDSAVLDGGNWRQWRAAERGGRTLGRALVRLLAPFYRPGKWLELARQSPYLLRHIKAFALVLRKEG